MFCLKPFVPPWRIRWSCGLQPCREMRWLWPTLYEQGLRHILPLKDPATPSPRNDHVPHRRWLAMILRVIAQTFSEQWRGRLVLPKWWWLRQTTLKGSEQLMLSASWTPLIPSRIRNTLWLLIPLWIVRWQISRWMRQQGPLFRGYGSPGMSHFENSPAA